MLNRNNKIALMSAIALAEFASAKVESLIVEQTCLAEDADEECNYINGFYWNWLACDCHATT